MSILCKKLQQRKELNCRYVFLIMSCILVIKSLSRIFRCSRWVVSVPHNYASILWTSKCVCVHFCVEETQQSCKETQDLNVNCANKSLCVCAYIQIDLVLSIEELLAFINIKCHLPVYRYCKVTQQTIFPNDPKSLLPECCVENPTRLLVWAAQMYSRWFVSSQFLTSGRRISEAIKSPVRL